MSGAITLVLCGWAIGWIIVAPFIVLAKLSDIKSRLDRLEMMVDYDDDDPDPGDDVDDDHRTNVVAIGRVA